MEMMVRRDMRRRKATGDPRMSTAGRLVVVLLLAGSATFADDPLRDGNAAYRAGDFDQAVARYESEEETTDLLTRRFNAGVSYIRKGAGDEAIERFEDVAARAEGGLRRSSLYNLGWSHFQGGKTIAGEAFSTEDTEERVTKLTAAAKSYRSAAEFFRRIDPPDEDVRHNIGVVKTALRTVLDEIARLEEAKRQKEEEELLKDPPQLVRHLIATEKMHRVWSRNLKDQPARTRRLPCRQLRKAEAKNRQLAEKLHHRLTREPEEGQAPPEEEKKRLEMAAAAVGSAIDAMKNAEVDYGKLDAERAVASHTSAVHELRMALMGFPLNIAEVIAEGLATQERAVSLTEALIESSEAGRGSAATDPEGAPASGVGKVLLDAIKDKALQPVAKFLAPKPADEANAIADEEEDVIWASGIVSQAEIPPTPPQPQGPVPGGGAAQPPGPVLDAVQAKLLSEALRAEGQNALAASTRAREQLATVELAGALEAEKQALEALKRAQELLPKPPKTPEERLRELILRQREALEGVKALAEVPEDARDAPAGALVDSQSAGGREAGGIAMELMKRQQDERAKRAIPKVQEGETAIYSSAEALRRRLLADSEGAIERDIAALEEALAILSGQDEQDQQQDQQQGEDEQQNRQDQQQNQSGAEEEKPKSMYQLSAEKAREEREKMDQERRKEEAKIFAGGSTITVEKDW